MDVMRNLLNTQITMLVLMMAGFVMSKRKLLSVEFRKAMTDFVMNFILPCNIIKSFLMEFNVGILRDCLAVCIVSTVTQVLTFLLGKAVYRRMDAERQPALRFATMVSNAGFLGNPIVEGLFGAQGLLYNSVYLIPQRIASWSVGVTCFTGNRGKGVIRRTLTHPCIVAVGIGLVLMLTQVTLPVWIQRPLELAGGCNTALSLIVIGQILAEADPRSMISTDALYFCLIRLAVIPLLVMAGCMAAGVDRLVLETTTVLAGMPAPLTAAMLASKYEKDEKFAVSMVFLSTILSVATIPALCLIMMGLSGSM